MNYNSIFKMILILISFPACAQKLNPKQYNYIEIQECTIPIGNKLYLKDKNIESSEYLFVSKKINMFKDNRLDSKIKIMLPKDNNEKITFMKSLNNFEYEKSTKILHGIEIWYLKEKYNNKNLNFFSFLFLDNSIIALTNISEVAVESMVNYCKLHPKKGSDPKGGRLYSR